MLRKLGATQGYCSLHLMRHILLALLTSVVIASTVTVSLMVVGLFLPETALSRTIQKIRLPASTLANDFKLTDPVNFKLEADTPRLMRATVTSDALYGRSWEITLMPFSGGTEVIVAGTKSLPSPVERVIKYLIEGPEDAANRYLMDAGGLSSMAEFAVMRGLDGL